LGLRAVIKKISINIAKITIKGLSTKAFYSTVRNVLGKKVAKSGGLLDKTLIAELKTVGIKFTESELTKFFNNQDEMINALYNTVKNEKHLSRILDSQGRLSYFYNIQTKIGSRNFTIATSDNSFIVSLIP
jgi:hypothetical protein